MVTSYPGIGNSNYWEHIDTWSATTNKLQDGSYMPIAKYQYGIAISFPLICIYADSNNAPGYYRKAGWFYQRIYTNLGTINATYSRVEKSHLLLLRTSNLIPINNALGEYSFIIEVPFWYDDITISIDGYQGPVVDSVESQLATIETKIDSLIEIPPPP